MSDNGHEDGPIEFWNIDGQPQPVQIGPRIVWDLRLARCQVQQLAEENERLRADQEAPPAKRITTTEVVKRFYRRKRYNPKLRLQDMAKEFGISYDTLRKQKRRLDSRKRKK